MRPFDGYPTSLGNIRCAVFPHAGPASYVPITINGQGVVITPGDTIFANECGLKYFDQVEGGVTDDGVFLVRIFPAAILSRLNSSLGPPVTKVYAQWIANKTGAFGGQAQVAGAEAVAATNLSAYAAIIRAFGPK